MSALLLDFFFISKGAELEVRLDPTAAIESLIENDRLLGTSVESICKIASKKSKELK
jgi:hypothetical protein